MLSDVFTLHLHVTLFTFNPLGHDDYPGFQYLTTELAHFYFAN